MAENRRFGTLLLTLFAMLASLCLVACSGRKEAPAAPSAAAQLQNVPPANPASYPKLNAAKSWRNPYLVIRADGVGMVTSNAANEEQIVKPEQILDALAQLPASAWPYGRAVAILVDGKTATSDQQKVALRKNRGLVAGQLESTHVEIRWVIGELGN